MKLTMKKLNFFKELVEPFKLGSNKKIAVKIVDNRGSSLL